MPLSLGLVTPTLRQITWIDWQLKSQLGKWHSECFWTSGHMPGRTSFGDRSNVFLLATDLIATNQRGFNGRTPVQVEGCHCMAWKIRNTKRTGKIHHASNGKIHYFDWAMFNSYVTNYQRVQYLHFQVSWLIDVDCTLDLWLVSSQKWGANGPIKLCHVLRLPDYRIYQSHFVGQLFWTRTNMGVDRNLNSPLLIGPGKRRSNFQKPWVHPWWSQQKRPPTMSNVNLELLIAQWVVKKRVEYHSNTKVSLCGCFGYHQFSWFIIMSAEKKSLAIYIYILMYISM